MPTREVQWNIEHVWLMYVLLVPTLVVFGYGIWLRVSRWLKGKPALRTDRIGDRIKGFVRDALAQEPIRRDLFAGAMHLAISWGFVFLFLATVVVMIHHDLGIPIMQGAFYLWFQSLAVDAFGLVFTVGLCMAIYRRYIRKKRRLAPSHGLFDDAFFLGSLLVLSVTGFLIEGIRIQATSDPWGLWSPVGYATGWLLATVGLSGEVLRPVHIGLWWFHLGVNYAWTAYLPFSKILHAFTAPASIFFRSLESRGRLQPINLEEMDEETVLGANRLTDFHWKSLLDLDACTECGLCQDACPAYAVDKPLNPKQIILNMQDLQRSREPGLPIIGNAINSDALWSCTTCMACVEACPVEIEHVDKIIELRRYQVMEESAIEETAQQALQGIEDRGHPFRGSQASRSEWYRDLPFVRDLSEVGRVDVLFWVGCAVAKNEGSQRIAQATATILHEGGVDFAVLGEEESCTGDPARRMGNEYLFQMNAEQNIQTLDQYGVKKVVTTCPHCFNTFKNEYPDLGGQYEVVHHSQLIRELIDEGRIEIDGENPFRGGEGKDGKRITFHDPCYLGRHNGEYDAPRGAIDAVLQVSDEPPGAIDGRGSTLSGAAGTPPLGERIEMVRSRERGFCCGAGGGRYWMEDQPGKRINVARAREAAKTGADIVATACPFCMLMMKDGMSTVEAEAGRVAETRDIAELVAASLKRRRDEVERPEASDRAGGQEGEEAS